MTKEETLVEFKKVLSPYTPDKAKLEHISEKTNLLKDLKINSANLVDIIIDAESNYNIEIDNDSVERMITVGDCMEVIMEKINKTAP